jgi:putative membrane protein
MSKRCALMTLFCLAAICSLVMPALAVEKGLARTDRLFIREVASSGMMESQLGQLAQEKGNTQEVRDFGTQMLADHTKAGVELKDLAAKKNVKLPEQLQLKHKTMVAKLSKLTGAKFDKRYLRTMVKAHLKEVASFKKAAKKLKDADLNAWAVQMLPVVEQHLQLAKEVAQKLGVK